MTRYIERRFQTALICAAIIAAGVAVVALARWLWSLGHGAGVW
jgi:hypothetical protein